MEAEECRQVGLLHHVVPAAEVLPRALAIAQELGAKPPVAMRIDKARFVEMTEASFQETIEAAIRHHRVSYASNEPQRMVEKFYHARGSEVPNTAAAA